MKKVKKRIQFNWLFVGLFLFVFIAFLGSLAILISALVSDSSSAREKEIVPKGASEDLRAFLWKDGETPFSVVIDNMKDAWPPAGLEFARIVFEAPVEAGITRLLAVFGSDDVVPLIGPVRSARPYFVDWAEEFGTLLAHVGGSSEALTRLQESELIDLDEFRYGGRYFDRVEDRVMPHNTFTSLDLLKKFFDRFSNEKETVFNRWTTKDDTKENGDAVRIVIPYTNPYDVQWEYRLLQNDYMRLVGDKPFVTASGTQIRAKNIVVMKTNITIIDSLSRRRIDTKNGGEAIIFQDGAMIQGMWKKEGGYTKFYQSNGAEVRFNRGPIWIEVVSKGMTVTYE